MEDAVYGRGAEAVPEPKRVEARFIRRVERLTDGELRLVMRDLVDSHPMDCVNWSDYPYAPEARFRIAHSDDALAVMFDVREDHVRAVALDDGGPVWEDSCVEFFAADPAGGGYFNFEANCIGTMLAARRTSREDAVHFDAARMGRIRRIASLPHDAVDSRGAGQHWWLAEVIPFELLGLARAPRTLRANFYKCGDACDRPHFLSWNPVRAPKPDFHRPESFGEVVLL